MNTRINYMYRDASNYKVQNDVIVPGIVSDEQISEIISCLDSGEFFIPSKVGFTEKSLKKRPRTTILGSNCRQMILNSAMRTPR